MEQELVHIDRLTYGSAGIGHLASGKTVFVEGGIPGDDLLIEVTKHHPKYSQAEIREVINPSVNRVVSPCPWAAECGGCTWQHMSYKAQIQAKRQNVVDVLARIGKVEPDQAELLVKDVVSSKHDFGYRNKVELNAGFSESQGFALGYCRKHTQDLVEPDKCLIAHKKIQGAPKALRGALRYMQGSEDLGIYRVGVRHSNRTGSFEVALWTTPGPFARARAAKLIESTVDATSVVRVIADSGKKRKIKQVEALSGKGFWCEELLGYRYKTSAPSFFQVNSQQAEVLVEAVLDAVSAEGEDVVVDLYAGGGTFSIPLASQFENVIAIEAASSSIKDLRRNAQDNGIDLTIIGGDSARELAELGTVHSVVVDPPRNGLGEAMHTALASAQPQQMIYVSCDPATWARDVALLDKGGYRLKSVQPVDMFPQTYHVELVSVFEKEN